mgnify:CR=1 FL=1
MILLIIILALIIYFIVAMNTIRRYNVKISESQADLEVYLIKRFDILTESLKVAKGYAKHESELMVRLMEARKGMTAKETQEVMNNQTEVFEKLFAVAENYPDLYSNELYQNLQKQITEENDHVAAAKRIYNSNISSYNQYIVIFPNSIVAKILRKDEKDFLKEEQLEEKKNVVLDV